MGRVLSGLSGAERRVLTLSWILATAIVILVMTIDIMTRRHVRPDEPLLAPVIDEGSSAIMTLIVLAIPAAVVFWTRRARPPGALLAPVHAIAALIYSIVHVGGFVALRVMAYPVMGRHYGFDVRTEYPYEFGKDLIAYIFGALVFWLVLRWVDGFVPGQPARTTYDIQDGARLLRIPTAEIRAVRSAGNYIEFHLADGRRPLRRSSLAAVEAELSSHGFVRTHRSWLVNKACVTGLRPEGSGDYAVELGEIEAPLSRRYREALPALRD